MALLQIKLVVARVMWLYDFKQPAGELGLIGGGHPDAKGGRHRVGEYQLNAHISAACDGPMLMFRPRWQAKEPNSLVKVR